jgi:neutral trehalase
MMSPQKISAITQPPVLALGARLVNDIAPSETWVKALYPRLCAYIEWDMAHRDSDGNGLLEWFIEGDPCCRSGESGMDNSPRFDRATQMDAVDFNAFLALECEVLAGFAASLGLNAEAAAWNGHHARLCRLIEDRLWSDESQFYVDYDLVGKAHSPVLASSGFLPLICGAASKERARILAAHLADPEMFGTAFPIPSIAAKDVRHYAKDMWRGPAWINLNWLVAMGFDRYDMHDVAARLRERTIAEIERFTEKHGVFFEFYDDRGEVEPPALLRKGKCAPRESPMHQVFHDYGWTATLYLDLAATKS